jgi:aspartate dehydrogenase
MKIGLIGRGAIARFVAEKLEAEGHCISAYLLRPQRAEESLAASTGSVFVSSVADLSTDIDCVVDCAGHEALRDYGAAVLRAGFDLTTVSLGALADTTLENDLRSAAAQSGRTLFLASGAIGALDALRSARIGDLKKVRYVGRKPPIGWLGSPAEGQLDLQAMTGTPATHFLGSARDAARTYPKNANVAAAVALAGIGFDRTETELIADPTVTTNIHEIHAEGSFGQLEFRICGNPLPGNPKSSALAAMSVVDTVLQRVRPMKF